MGIRIPSVDIQFGGKTRRLIFDFNAMAELQDIAGTFSSETPSLKLLRASLWACLLADTLDSRGRQTKGTLSLIEVGELLAPLSADDLADISAKVNEAIRLSHPEIVTGDAKPDPLSVSTEPPAA